MSLLNDMTQEKFKLVVGAMDAHQSYKSNLKKSITREWSKSVKIHQK